MADDPTKKKTKDIFPTKGAMLPDGSMLRPPPAVAPSFIPGIPANVGVMPGAENQAAQAITQPQMSFGAGGAAPVNAQSFMPAPQNPGFLLGDIDQLGKPAVDKATYDAQAANVAKLQTLADTAQNNRANIASQMQPVPTDIPQSEFERKMSEGVANRIQKLLSDQSGPGERFSRGFDFGQKLAANVVLPLMGSFSHSMGGQMGYTNASQYLNQLSMQNDQNRRAEAYQKNAMMANLASLYENMSPNSIKNLTSLAALQHQKLSYNREIKKDAEEQEFKTQDAVVKGNQALLGTRVKDSEAAKKDILGGIKEHNNVADKIQDNARGDKQIAISDRNAKVGEGNLIARKQEAADKEADRKADNVRADSKEAIEHQKEARLIIQRLITQATKKDTNGRLIDPGAIERFKRDPLQTELLNQHLKGGGTKATAEQAIDSYLANSGMAQQAPTPGNGNIFDNIVQGGKQLFSQAQPGVYDTSPPTKSVIPEKSAPAKAIEVPGSIRARIVAAHKALGADSTDEQVQAWLAKGGK